MKRSVLALAIALPLLAGSGARADDTAQPRPRYGLTIAAVDVASAAVTTVGVALYARDDSGGAVSVLGLALAAGGVGGYALGGPIVHGLRHNPGAVWRSFGARLLFPIAGVVTGLVISSEFRSELDGDDVAAGTATSIGVAMVLDWLFLARAPARPCVQPAPHGGGAVVGLAGAF